MQNIEDIASKAKGKSSKSVCPKPIILSKWLLEDEPKPKQILKDLIDMGTKVLIAGPPKARKSFFVMQLGLSIAAGKAQFLKWEIVKPRRVLLIQSEITKGHIHHRFKGIIKNLGITQEELGDNFYLVNARGAAFLDVDNLPTTFLLEIANYAKEIKAEVVILDPIYKYLLNENNPEDWKPLLSEIDKLINDTGVSVFMVHHYAKGWASDKQAMDRTSGSGVLQRDADFGINIDLHVDDDVRVIGVPIQRNYASTKDFCVRVEGNVFFVDDSTKPEIKHRNDVQNAGKPQVDDEKALAFFWTGAKPVASFRVYLAGLTSAPKAIAKYNDLKDSKSIEECYSGKGGVKVVGTPAQIKEIRQQIEDAKKPVQQKFEVLDTPIKSHNPPQ